MLPFRTIWLSLFLAGAATAAQAGADLAAEGRMLASVNCARCHSIDKTGASPMPVAPPFREFAAKWPLDQLEEALAEGIMTGHPDMPEFQFKPNEIEALIAFLDSLAR